MTETFKHKSRIISLCAAIIVSILTYISTMTPQGLAEYLPPEYAGIAALIIVIASAIVNAYSEEKRVQRAEELAILKSTTVLGTPIDGGVILNEEYTTHVTEGDEDGT